MEGVLTFTLWTQASNEEEMTTSVYSAAATRAIKMSTAEAQTISTGLTLTWFICCSSFCISAAILSAAFRFSSKVSLIDSCQRRLEVQMGNCFILSLILPAL